MKAFYVFPAFRFLQWSGALMVMLLVSCTTKAQCNGSSLLCSKKYNEVAYLTTHNAFNSLQGNFSLPNQNIDITEQLTIGVRAFMLDVYDYSGDIVVYHGFPFLGTNPLEDELLKIKTFLDANPNEVVTVILECYVSADDIETEMMQSGLMSYVYEHPQGTSWPTLQTMISNNTRCVVFSDVDDASASQGWYHYMWTNMVETHFSNHTISDFSCDFNRGDSINDLFILNHFITDATYGTGMLAESEIANSNPFFINRALQCQQEKQKFPNFVTVDFVELGDSKVVVDILNGIEFLGTPKPANTDEFSISPNPTNDRVFISTDKINLNELHVISSSGKDVTGMISILSASANQCLVDCSALQGGVYVIQCESYAVKFIKE